MLSLSELKFAQRYPFSELGKRVVREADFALDAIPDAVVARAETLVQKALRGEDYASGVETMDSLLKNEVLSFPVAKILLSCMERDDFYAKFADAFAKTTFRFLEGEKTETLLDLANELRVPFDLSEREAFLVSLPVLEFLKSSFKEEFMRLVNQPVARGRIFLTRNEFARYLSRLAAANLRLSLPVDISVVPASLKKRATQLKNTLLSTQFRTADFKPIGSIKPEHFPECMANLYARLVGGENLPHFARFDIATFLLALGMPPERVMDLFKFAPNYSERMTRYHVSRLAEKGISPPSCDKLREHGFACRECSSKHPLVVYRRNLYQAKKPDNASNASAQAAASQTPSPNPSTRRSAAEPA